MSMLYLNLYVGIWILSVLILGDGVFERWLGHEGWNRHQWDSVQFCCSLASDSLWSHGLQHARPPCPSPTPGAYPNSCPLSWWRHPTISSSVIPFASRLQSFPISGSFPVSQFFTSGSQSTEVLALASVLPMNIQGWFPLGWTGLISLQSKGLVLYKRDPREQPCPLCNVRPRWADSHL